jgi:hypothetical protein
MSALGQKRTFHATVRKSAYPPKADMANSLCRGRMAGLSPQMFLNLHIDATLRITTGRQQSRRFGSRVSISSSYDRERSRSSRSRKNSPLVGGAEFFQPACQRDRDIDYPYSPP